MTRRLLMILFVLFVAVTTFIQPTVVSAVNLELAPLSDTYVSSFVQAVLKKLGSPWDPSTLPDSLEGTVAGGAGFDSGGYVRGYLATYQALFPPLQFFFTVADEFGGPENGRFAAGWFMKSPAVTIDYSNLLSFTVQLNNLPLLQITEVASPTEFKTSPMNGGMTFGFTFYPNDKIFNDQKFWGLALPLSAFGLEPPEGMEYWALAIIAQDHRDFPGFPDFNVEQFIALMGTAEGSGTLAVNYVPLPGALWLLGTGLLGLAGLRRRFNRRG